MRYIMKKLALAIAVGISMSAGAVTCGENQQPDYTNSYCEDVEVEYDFKDMKDFWNRIDDFERAEIMDEGCKQLYNVYVGQLMALHNGKGTTLLCDAECKVKRSSFKPLGVLSECRNETINESLPGIQISSCIGIDNFNQQLRWLGASVMKEDPEISNPEKLINSFNNICYNNGRQTVVDFLQLVADKKFGGDVNKMFKYAEKFQ